MNCVRSSPDADRAMTSAVHRATVIVVRDALTVSDEATDLRRKGARDVDSDDVATVRRVRAAKATKGTASDAAATDRLLKGAKVAGSDVAGMARRLRRV